MRPHQPTPTEEEAEVNGSLTGAWLYGMDREGRKEGVGKPLHMAFVLVEYAFAWLGL
jgi:hypothetical protein